MKTIASVVGRDELRAGIQVHAGARSEVDTVQAVSGSGDVPAKTEEVRSGNHRQADREIIERLYRRGRTCQEKAGVDRDLNSQDVLLRGQRSRIQGCAGTR